MIKNIIKGLHGVLKKKYTDLELYRIKESYYNAKNASLSLEQIIKYNRYRAEGPQVRLCNAPFSSLFINMDGTVNVCGYNKTFILGNVYEKSLNSIWLGNKHNLLLDSINNYNLENGCQICKHKINTEDYHRAAIYFDTPKSSQMNDLKKITFEVSNLCNLECVMCNGELSSLIRKNREGREPLIRPDLSVLLDNIKDTLPYIEFAQFLGGEPLLIKIYYDIWNEILKNNKKCTISIQTNCSVMPEKFVSLLNSSSQFIISVSIDSFIKESFERIRQNANFDEVMKNFYIYFDLKKQKKIQLSINFTPMTINWAEIPSAITFANKHEIYLSMCEVESPYEYSFYSLSIHELEEVIAYLIENTPNNHSNSIEKQNLNLYKKQISQLEHLKLNMIYAEKAIITDDITLLEIELHSKLNQLPCYDIIKCYINKMFFDKVNQLKDSQKTIAIKHFIRYIELRKNILNQRIPDVYNLETLKALLRNELDSAFKMFLTRSD